MCQLSSANACVCVCVTLRGCVRNCCILIDIWTYQHKAVYDEKPIDDHNDHGDRNRRSYDASEHLMLQIFPFYRIDLGEKISGRAINPAVTTLCGAWWLSVWIHIVWMVCQNCDCAAWHIKTSYLSRFVLVSLCCLCCLQAIIVA